MDHTQQHLITKLGYTSGEAVDTVDAPEWFLEYLRGNGVHTHAKLPAEWLHMFMTDIERLAHFMAHLKFNEIQKGLWISWPKEASGLRTDITEQQLRDILLSYGWVEAAACDIDDHWNAVQFVEKNS